MSEVKKYAIRFGITLVLAIPILLLTQGAQAMRIIAYKVCLASIAIGLAELIWTVFFKPVFGKTEELTSEDLQSVMLFRGILYAAVIVALTLGL